MVMFLASLVTYPFAFLLTQAAAASGTAGLPGGVGGGSIDTRKRLVDFPEGSAIADLESVQQALYHPVLLRFLGVPLAGVPPLAELVERFMPHAQQLLADGSPHLALVELQRRVLPSVEALKSALEQRHRLARGPTPLERLDWITSISRTASFFFFSWLRGLARLCTYISSILSVVSGALSFTSGSWCAEVKGMLQHCSAGVGPTRPCVDFVPLALMHMDSVPVLSAGCLVVPSIILSVFSAAAGIGALLLTGTADLLEPAVNGLLALTESSKDTAASLSGGSPVCSRHLPPATVEQLEAFFQGQLAQGRAVRELLTAAQSQVGAANARGGTDCSRLGHWLQLEHCRLRTPPGWMQCVIAMGLQPSCTFVGAAAHCMMGARCSARALGSNGATVSCHVLRRAARAALWQPLSVSELERLSVPRMPAAVGVLHMLLRGGSRAAVAATAFDVPGVLAAANELARGLAGRLLPGFVGGGGTYARQLFRKDGFFAYADERQAQMALVLLCRLLSWLHLGSIVAPGSSDCLHFVLVMGEAQAGKASLFQQLVAAPPEYAGQLGGSATSGGPGGLGSGGVTSGSGELKGVTKPAGKGVTHSRAAAGGVPGSPHTDAPAVDIRPLADSANVYACVFPGLHSHDAATSRLSNSLAQTLERGCASCNCATAAISPVQHCIAFCCCASHSSAAAAPASPCKWCSAGFASAVVFLVHPGSEPSPDKLAALEGPLAAGRQCLVAINGPGRVKGLTAGTSGATGGGSEQFCAVRGLPPSLLGVVVSELRDDAPDVPPGVHKYKQVQDWIVNTVNHAHRMVSQQGPWHQQQMPGTAAAEQQSGNPGKEEALRQAASSGDVAQVHQLLASGADPNAVDVEGWTALHWASAQAEIAGVLLDAGASVNATDLHGKTTLHWAATEGQQEAAAVLLAGGADVHALDNDLWTPLQWAHEHAGVVQLLLGAGAEADAVDKFGKTCLHWAVQDGKTDVVRLLLAAGAAPNKADHDAFFGWACAAYQFVVAFVGCTVSGKVQRTCVLHSLQF
ncbi:hypothetical protein COO60DRAFT_1460173 [Scenedesmus sp. NREL 46B-D3]|nr:hypothetical protein COO60DRAFT_1460173 [Scenedesmus sp. NREL 46B-D3]